MTQPGWTPEELEAKSGKISSIRIDGRVMDHVEKTLEKDPIEIIAKTVKQQRDSMIGSLCGAYLTMTNADPSDVELIQQEKPDGSVSFRFKSREPIDYLWVIGDDEGPICICAPHLSEEAARAKREEFKALPENSGMDIWIAKVPFHGFVEDIKCPS